MEQLRKGPFRIPEPLAPYLDKKFKTASGKFEFMTEFDPAKLEPEAADYPYCLLTIAPHGHICSERTLGEHAPLPEVLLHPDEAIKQGVEDGTPVWVESPVGRIKALLKTDSAMRKDCLVAERGGWIKAGHGFNRLTTDQASTVGDGTPYYSTLVRVRPLA